MLGTLHSSIFWSPSPFFQGLIFYAVGLSGSFETKVGIFLEKKLALLDAKKPELFETPGQNNGKNCVKLSFGFCGQDSSSVRSGPGGSEWSRM